MAHIVTLKDNNDEISYPITPVDAVFVDSNTTLSEELSDKADADLANVSAGAVTTAKIADGAVTSTKITNGAVTAGKIDFSTLSNQLVSGTTNANGVLVTVFPTTRKILSVVVNSPDSILILPYRSGDGQNWFLTAKDPVSLSSKANTAISVTIYYFE